MNRALDPADFVLLRDYLRRTAGLEFDEGRRSGLASVVHQRLAATGLPDVATYLASLGAAGDPDDAAAGPGAPERQRLLDAVTIQETHFHRARPQIEALRAHILPDLLRRAARAHREAVVWSAGCSTGEEAFTLAMLMLEVAQQLPDPPPMRVVGTDVSTAALEVASAAAYSGRTVDLAERTAVERWLVRADDGTYVVRDEVRAMVELAHHNLVTEPPPFPTRSVDLVVCRHVTIYFARETTRALVGRFRDTLQPGGWLLLGPAESLWQVSDDFSLQAVGEAFAYRSPSGPAFTALPPEARRAQGSAPAAVWPPLLPPGHRPAHARPAARTVARPVPRPAAARRPVAPSPADRPSPAAVTPAVRARKAIESASAAFDTGAYDQAAALAQAALDVDPVSAEAYVLLGHARLNIGDAAAAVEPLQRAVFLDPLAGHAHFLLAVALSSAGRRTQAGPAYRAAANTLPGVPPDTVRRMLDGRHLAELLQLCLRLADDADREADAIRRGA